MTSIAIGIAGRNIAANDICDSFQNICFIRVYSTYIIKSLSISGKYPITGNIKKEIDVWRPTLGREGNRELTEEI